MEYKGHTIVKVGGAITVNGRQLVLCSDQLAEELLKQVFSIIDAIEVAEDEKD